jgi:hypothetical protein
MKILVIGAIGMLARLVITYLDIDGVHLLPFLRKINLVSAGSHGILDFKRTTIEKEMH